MSFLSRDRLDALPRRRLHGGRNLTKAVVDLVDVGGRPVVIKDLRTRPWPIRLILAPLQIEREARAYRLLEGIAGVPCFLGLIDRDAIALEYIPGRDLSVVRPGELAETFFDRLEAIIGAIHGRGVAHGDLHRRDVLAGPDDRPYVVDFSTSVVAGRDADPLLRFLFGQMCQADRRAVARLRRRLLPGSRVKVPEAPCLYRAGSTVRRLIGRLLGR